CGCSIDAVHDVDMAPRFANVRERGTALAGRLLERFAGQGSSPMIWDPLPWPREAVVTVNGRPTRDRTGGLGFAPVLAATAPPVIVDGDGAIENGFLRVEVEPDGSFVIVDKATNERGGRQNRLISEGDRGDEYTHSYAGPTVGSEGVSGTRATSVAGDRATATVELILRLPARIREDRLARSPELVDCPVQVEISLDAGERRGDVPAEVHSPTRHRRPAARCP